MSSKYRLVGTASTPREIANCLRSRRLELGLTQSAVCHLAGVQDGYVGKLEVGVRTLGPMSLGAMLGALGLRLAVIADDASLPAITRRELKPKRRAARVAA